MSSPAEECACSRVSSGVDDGSSIVAVAGSPVLQSADSLTDYLSTAAVAASNIDRGLLTLDQLILMMIQDYKLRQHNTTRVRPIYTYTDVENELPTLNRRIVYTIGPGLNFEESLTEADVIRRINYKYPFLAGLNMDNLLIAGGAISNIISSASANQSDVDIFIYGLSYDAAKAKVQYIIEYFTSTYPDEVYGIITRNIVKLYWAGKEVQIILRLYKSIDEILYGFDLGSCAVGYNGSNILFSLMGKFSFANKCNIVDHSRRSTTYEYRLSKYFTRGFDIIVPFVFRDDSNQSIVYPGDTLYWDYPCNLKLHSYHASPISDYDPYYNKPPLAQLLYHREEPTSHVFGNISLLKNSIAVCKRYSFEKLCGNFGKNMALIVMILQNPSEFDYIEQTIPVFAPYMLDDTVWITENPGTQLTSSINPIIEDMEACIKWYGPRVNKSALKLYTNFCQ